MRDCILMHCQHGVGIGHLVRSFAIAEQLSRFARVVVLCGGEVPDSIRLPDSVEVVLLPALRMGSEGELYASQGADLSTTLDRRRDVVLGALRELRPSAVVVELFPFGRKKIRGELVPLLEEAGAQQPSAFRVCSVRDFLVTARRDQRAHDDRACSWANRLIDLILVHADPSVARLEETFRPTIALETRVQYTGFVTRPAPRRAVRQLRILVSAGGGVVGEPLLAAALEAQPELWRKRGLRMRLIAGPFLPDAGFKRLRRAVRSVPAVELVRSVPDLGAEMCAAAASLSQCGYNTTLDLLRTDTPALVVPYSTPSEDEQLRRARRLQRLGLLHLLEPDRLDPRALSAALEALLDVPVSTPRVDLDGARCTARIIIANAVGEQAAVGAVQA